MEPILLRSDEGRRSISGSDDRRRVRQTLGGAGAANQPASGSSFSPVGSGPRQMVLASKRGASD